MRRFNTGYCNGQYSLPAGHVEVKESPISCLIRESAEEIGVVIKKEAVDFVHTMYRPLSDAANQRIDLFFEVSNWSGDIKNKESHKCDDIRWCSLDALPENTIPYIRAALTAVLERRPYSECTLGDKNIS